MHLDAEVIGLRVRPGEGADAFAGTEADLQAAARAAAEHRVEVEGLRVELDAMLWPQFLQRTLLASGHATGAQHEGADTAQVLHAA